MEREFKDGFQHTGLKLGIRESEERILWGESLNMVFKTLGYRQQRTSPAFAPAYSIVKV